MNNCEPIDFDAASRAWRANKIALPNGTFCYKCHHKSHSREGKFCRKRAINGTLFCKYHLQKKPQLFLIKVRFYFCLKNRSNLYVRKPPKLMPTQCYYVNKAHQRCPCHTILAGGLCSRHKKCDVEVHKCLSDILAQFSHFKLNELFQYMMFLEPSSAASSASMVKVLQHAFSKQAILEYASQTCGPQHILKSATIAQAAEAIVDLYFKLLHANKYAYYIRKLQKKWRQSFAKRLEGPYPEFQPVNSEDPFTCDDIATIPIKELFSYRDSTGHVYAFRATHLLYSINRMGPLNPYTRETIPDADITRLHRTIKQYHLDTKIIDEEARWRTPQDAFTDVLYDYELYGFYTSLEWFTTLTIQQIYEMYYELSTDRRIPMSCFSLSKLDMSLQAENNPDDAARFCLADDMKNLIESNHPLKFYIICNLFVVLAVVQPTLRNSLPTWVLTGAGI